MKLILTDPAPEVLAAWKLQLAKWPEVDLRSESVLETEADAILLPGNAFGFLDSGLALEACERFGFELQEETRRFARAQPLGEILVGQAALLQPGGRPRRIIFAPLWRTPRKLEGTVNVYLALRAGIAGLRSGLGETASLAVPALGVQEGGLPPLISARQIRYAYEVATGLRGPGDKNLTQQIRRERKLMTLPLTDSAEPAEQD